MMQEMQQMVHLFKQKQGAVHKWQDEVKQSTDTNMQLQKEQQQIKHELDGITDQIEQGVKKEREIDWLLIKQRDLRVFNVKQIEKNAESAFHEQILLELIWTTHQSYQELFDRVADMTKYDWWGTYEFHELLDEQNKKCINKISTQVSMYHRDCYYYQDLDDFLFKEENRIDLGEDKRVKFNTTKRPF